VVLSEDPFAIPPEHIRDVVVETTVVGGRVASSAGDSAGPPSGGRTDARPQPLVELLDSRGA